ncbi:MAG: hydrogenase subunit MbhD domain-containing protein [Chloroflexota bacterium]|nr:hydrogenase subunit MbhD domain-containing protein [Chloroflexota bacterium]
MLETLIYGVLVGAAIFSAIQSLRADSLLRSAIWLAGVSVLLSIVIYLLGAYQVAVIELSVGAGLVTVLFVFAISVAGDEGIGERSLVPKPLAWALVLFSGLLLIYFILPIKAPFSTISKTSLTAVFWEDRSLDLLVQVVLIYSGVLGLVGILAEAKAPLQQSMVDEVAAERERALQEMEIMATPEVNPPVEAQPNSS